MDVFLGLMVITVWIILCDFETQNIEESAYWYKMVSETKTII